MYVHFEGGRPPCNDLPSLMFHGDISLEKFSISTDNKE